METNFAKLKIDRIVITTTRCLQIKNLFYEYEELYIYYY